MFSNNIDFFCFFFLFVTIAFFYPIIIINVCFTILCVVAAISCVGLASTGIFRESGLQSNMKKIKNALNKGLLLLVFSFFCFVLFCFCIFCFIEMQILFK